MNQQFVLREGQIKDLNEMQELFVNTIKTVCISDYDNQQIKAWVSSVNNQQRWNEIVTKQFVVVAQYANKMVGFATLENGKHIDLLYVHKDHQRKGVARKLLDNIETEAKRLHQKELTSDVSKTARPFFKKSGFTILTEQIVNRDGVKLKNYKMIKKLK